MAFDNWCKRFADSLPGVGVLLLDSELRVMFANAACADLFYVDGRGVSAIQGHSLHSVDGFLGHWDSEETLRGVLAGGNDCLVRSVRRGQQVYTLLRREEIDGEAHVLTVTRCVAAGEDEERLLRSGYPVHMSGRVDLGGLSVLSPREIEVLALIGQGMTIREIAGVLHRSEKTVGNHRISMGHKLGKSNKVELALLARNAGLRMDHAQRERYPVGGGPRGRR